MHVLVCVFLLKGYGVQVREVNTCAQDVSLMHEFFFFTLTYFIKHNIAALQPLQLVNQLFLCIRYILH